MSAMILDVEAKSDRRARPSDGLTAETAEIAENSF
jgi:hypothetical protein